MSVCLTLVLMHTLMHSKFLFSLKIQNFKNRYFLTHLKMIATFWLKYLFLENPNPEFSFNIFLSISPSSIHKYHSCHENCGEI